LRIGIILGVFMWVLCLGTAYAQTSSDTDTSQPIQLDKTKTDATADNAPASTSGAFYMFDHSKPSKFWISVQSNSIFQYHPAFHSPYSGPNSFVATPESKVSVVDSLYLGYQLIHSTNAFFTLERFDGSGLSKGLGMAGLPDLDVVRNPSLGGQFYIARLGLHTVIPLSQKMITVDRSPTQLLDKLPEKRLEISAGKFSAVDYLNYNAVGSDVHKQFMNWDMDNDVTYDFPADTRGYTVGAAIEYKSPNWEARFLEAMMPIHANGQSLDWDLLRNHSETYELVRHYQLFHRRPGTIRLLAFDNHANMGNYQQAINDYAAGLTSTPNIVLTEKPGREKYGFGLNLEQEIKEGLTLFSRLGWNDGHSESFTYTEANNTVVLGAALQGKRWHRPNDKIGLAVATDGLSSSHKEYLALGGLGFELGDGALNYGRENLIEMYYSCHVWKGVYAGPDFQFVKNPGYNRDRGPVPIISFRLHVDF